MSMPETHNLSPEVTDYIQKITQDWQVDICNRLRNVIHQAIPDVKERIFMTTPNYVKNGKTVCVFFAAKSWVNLSIFKTKDLEIPEGLFDPSDNPDRMQVKIKKGKGIDDDAFTKFLKQVADAV
jgi:hypothetical protein